MFRAVNEKRAGLLFGAALMSMLSSPVFAQAPVIDSPTEALASVGVPFSYTITASDAPTSFTAAGLPAAVTIDTTTGIVSGTFMATGSVSVNLSATNAAGTGVETLLITVASSPPAITSAATAAGTVGTAFMYQIAASNSPTSFDALNLPPGLDVDTAAGIVSGAPAAGGVFTVTVSAANDGGTGILDVAVTIAGPALTIVSDLTATGKAGADFSYEILTDGEAAVSFTVSGLPDGLTADGGSISGAPAASGTFSITLMATGVSGGTDTKTLVLTVLDKSADIGPQVGAISVDPDPPFTGEMAVFSIDAQNPDNGDVSVTWDFGDGTTLPGAEVTHAFAAAGTYTVTATASDGTKTTAKTVTLIVGADDPNAPTLDGFTADVNPASVNQAVSFTASAADPNGAPLLYAWNFGDGSPLGAGISPSHAWTKEGVFTVKLTVKDATGLPARASKMDIFVINPTGIGNIDEGQATFNPLDGLTQKVTSSDGGVIGLSIDVDALVRGAFVVTTSLSGRSAVKGVAPVMKAPSAGIFIALTEARDTGTLTLQGHARKTLPVSRRELNLPPLVTAEPLSHKLKVKQLNGSFNLASSSVIAGRAAGTAATTPSAAKAKPDAVTATGTIDLPAGLDLSTPQEVQFSVGIWSIRSS